MIVCVEVHDTDKGANQVFGIRSVESMERIPVKINAYQEYIIFISVMYVSTRDERQRDKNKVIWGVIFVYDSAL